MNMVESDQVNSYFRAAMKEYELEEARMNGEQSAFHPPESEIDMPVVDMESVGSCLSRSHDHDRARRDQRNKRLPQVAMAETSDDGGFSNQMIGMFAMAELKVFAGRENNEKRARQWIHKVKSAFRRDQVHDAEKCLAFRDILTGPACDWYKQLSGSTRTSWKSLLEKLHGQIWRDERCFCWETLLPSP